MKQAKGYILKDICGVPYILPYGQNIADRKRGVRLNESGEFLWNSLASPISRETLLSNFASHYQARPQMLPDLENDLDQFLQTLSALGMIDFCEEHEYLIGGIRLCLFGHPDCIPEEFLPFTQSAPTHDTAPKLTIELLPATDSVYHPVNTQNNRLLLENAELTIHQVTNGFLFHFPTMTHLKHGFLSLDGTHSKLFYELPYEALLREELFHAIRFLYLYLAEKNDIYAIHSASILYKGKAWLFSGPSGTGKSTHANLWKALYQTPVLNGDLNLLAFENGMPVIHGLPWCGTSRISDVHTYPLGGILLLRQDKTDFIEDLSMDEKALLLMQRLISPIWNEQQLDCCLRFSEKLMRKCYVARLHCTKEDSAARTMKHAIDEQLNN